MAAEDLFIPRGLTRIPIGPLNRGIALHEDPDDLSQGGLVDVQDYDVRRVGLRRRGTFSSYGSGKADYPPLRDLMTGYKTDGAQFSAVIDSKFLYQPDPTAFTGKYWKYDTGTCSSSGVTVTGSGTAWADAANAILPGDIFVFDPAGSPEEVEIAVVNNNTELELVSTPSGDPYGAGTAYEIRRAFKVLLNDHLDWTFADNKILFTDGSREIYSYNGTTFGLYSAGNYGFYAGCIAHFGDRLWLGHIAAGGNEYRQLIRYSELGDFDNFPTSNWIEKPYSSGNVKRLVPLSNLLVAYYSDRVYIGSPSSLPNSVIRFDAVETGGVGLAGSKAIVRYLDSHFWVGKDDIYHLTPQKLDRIGDPIVRKTVEKCTTPSEIYGIYDPVNSRVIFGFPIDGERINELWFFNLKSGGWSRHVGDFSMLATADITREYTYADLVDVGSGGILSSNDYSGFEPNYPTYGSLKASGSGTPTPYIGGYDSLYFINEAGSLDFGVIVPQGVIETGDHIHGEPETKKVWVKVSLTILEAAAVDLPFVVERSMDRGQTWKEIGTLKIVAGKIEGSKTFRATGTRLRLRFTCAAEVEPYIVTSYDLTVKPMGPQVAGRE